MSLSTLRKYNLFSFYNSLLLCGPLTTIEAFDFRAIGFQVVVRLAKPASFLGPFFGLFVILVYSCVVFPLYLFLLNFFLHLNILDLTFLDILQDFRSRILFDYILKRLELHLVNLSFRI